MSNMQPNDGPSKWWDALGFLTSSVNPFMLNRQLKRYDPLTNAAQGAYDQQNLQNVVNQINQNGNPVYVPFGSGPNMAYDARSYLELGSNPMNLGGLGNLPSVPVNSSAAAIYYQNHPKGPNATATGLTGTAAGQGTGNAGVQPWNVAANLYSQTHPTATGAGTTEVTYLDMLKSLLEQGAGGGGNFGAALASIRKERAGVNKTYKENKADIKNMFGNLTTSRQSDIPKYGELQAAGREGAAQQTQAIASQTRDAEAARLEAANRARAELGLGDIAAASATGDIATQASEAGLADQAALAEITRNSGLTNQAIGEQAIQDEIQRYASDQTGALQDLGTTRDAYLRDISGREQNILSQQAAAQAQASQANAQFQLQIAGLMNQYEQGMITPGTPEDALSKWISNYAGGGEDQAATADAATTSAAFWNWIHTADQLTNKTTNKPLTANEALGAFTKYDPETAKLLQANPYLNLLLLDMWNGKTSSK